MQDQNQPESLKLAAVMPTMTVQDIEASLKWYTEVLGCVVETRLESEGKLLGVAVRAGTAHFVLGQDDASARPASTGSARGTHQSL